MSPNTPSVRALAVLLLCVAAFMMPVVAAAQDSPCAAEAVCKQPGSAPADDWFRHGIEALAQGEGTVAVCALDRAIQAAPEEDGHNLTSFVKPMLGGVKKLPRDCRLSSAPLDKKKYFPRLYLAKAFLDLAVRAAEADKGKLCDEALTALAGSREEAPFAKVQQQLERRERVDRALRDSRCCDLQPQAAPCSADR